MKVRIEDVALYKKVMGKICSIPSVRKQLNGVEQCIELNANKEDGVLEISTVDLTSHSVTLKMDAEIVEEGRQIVLSNKIKAMTSKLNPKYGLEIYNDNDLINYEAKPFGSISEPQYFAQTAELSMELVDEPDWTTVTPELGYFMDLIPLVCSTTYQDREIYMASKLGELKLYVQFSETSYIRYTVTTGTNATIPDFSGTVRPALLRIVEMLGDEVSLDWCKKDGLIKFQSESGTVAIVSDLKKNKTATMFDKVTDKDFDSKIEVDHEDLTESIKFQSYATVDSDIIKMAYDEDEEQFLIKAHELNKPSRLHVSTQGHFTKTTLSVGHFSKALKAMGSPKNKVLPVNTVVVRLKSLPVKNSKPIKVIHLAPEIELDVTSDVIMYEASC